MPMFKVIIAGGRDFKDTGMCLRAMDHLLANKMPHVQVVCGGARGADQVGHDCAKMRSLSVKFFYPDWDRLGKSAGYIRNKQMGDYADALIAFWDGKSKGTKHMIDYMKELGKPVRVVKY